MFSAAIEAAAWVRDDPELGEEALPEGAGVGDGAAVNSASGVVLVNGDESGTRVVDVVGRCEGEAELIGAVSEIMAICIVPFSVLR
jgi:hypothetical protein